MSIEEFKTADSRFAKQSAIYTVGPLLASLFCMLAYQPFRLAAVDRMSTVFGETLGTFVANFFAVLPFCIFLASIVPIDRWIRRQFGIPCIHCGKELAQRSAVVIASRNCPHCGRRVLDDPV